MKNIEKYTVKGCPCAYDGVNGHGSTVYTSDNNCVESEGDCFVCWLNFVNWLMEEAEEPVDWSKVAVDTPILVRDSGTAEWKRRLFACHKDGLVHAWDNGRSSFTAEFGMSPWKCARLYKGEEDEEH